MNWIPAGTRLTKRGEMVAEIFTALMMLGTIAGFGFILLMLS